MLLHPCTKAPCKHIYSYAQVCPYYQHKHTCTALLWYPELDHITLGLRRLLLQLIIFCFNIHPPYDLIEYCWLPCVLFHILEAEKKTVTLSGKRIFTLSVHIVSDTWLLNPWSHRNGLFCCVFIKHSVPSTVNILKYLVETVNYYWLKGPDALDNQILLPHSLQMLHEPCLINAVTRCIAT